jgi:prolyl oligopeptidase
VGKAPTQDNLLVFYFSDSSVWDACCQRMLAAGFVQVTAYNDYWDEVGNTFEDLDGYRVVLQNREWTA